MVEKRVLGTTKVSDRWRISLIEKVREEFEADDRSMEIGDVIVYRLVDGKVVVEPAKGSEKL